MQGVIAQANGENWHLYNGDSCEVLKSIPDNSIDFGIHSPPFSNLYIYSDSEADLGNSANDEEFIEHYKFIIREMYRATVPGRLCAVHCKDLPKYANRDDTAGLKDFPGDIIRAFESCGWSYHSNVTIWKCPVVERERTNNNGLLHKTVKRDRSQIRQGMCDFLKVFRKPPQGTLMSDKPIIGKPRERVGDDGATEYIATGFTEYVGDPEIDPRYTDEHPSPYARKRSIGESPDTPSINIWRRYAEGVWWDICQTDVLNNWKQARSEKDERHICPLQLGLIERAVELWSMPGEVVFSPFAGIGSEGVGSLRRKRKFLGIELKPEYFNQACRNLKQAESASTKPAERCLFE
jgi:DNA modification methylase